MTNQEKYRKFCKEEKNLPIFCKDWWLDCVCGEQNWNVALVEKGGTLFATMPYFLTKRYGMNIITQPILTPSLGIYFKYPEKQKYYKKLSFEKEMIEKIIEQLPKYSKFYQSFNFEYTNLLPFYWAGFDISARYTYVIENIQLAELEKNFETDIRKRRRKKAYRIGVEIYESTDIKKFYELNKMTFKRQGIGVPYSLELITKLYKACQKNNAVKMYFAKYKDEVIAANFLIYDSKTVYYLMGGINPNKKDLGAMDLIQYESIRFALENGRRFDFEGSVIESIEKYFRSFGAIQKPYFTVSKINSKILKVRSLIKEVIK